MSADRLGALLVSGEEQYRLLLDEATALLRHFDTNSPEDFERAVGVRGQIIATLTRFDQELAAFLGTPSSSADPDTVAVLNGFRRFQEEVTRKILELDSFVIALARQRLDALQDDMASLARGRTALHGYEGGREDRHNMSSTA
ncbi:MAG: flagellar protein FliT [Desulfuromonadales bacterium]|nr:MAG: flagellar protein FliT [Desulfuromonadales bacterium]